MRTRAGQADEDALRRRFERAQENTALSPSPTKANQDHTGSAAAKIKARKASSGKYSEYFVTEIPMPTLNLTLTPFLT